MEGLLVVDKPAGPTSHDVVSRVRRVLRERRVGHTGTLDPLATGVLPLLVGRATRLARFMNADGKRYEATIRLRFATDTYDALGRPSTQLYTGELPDRDQIEHALDRFRGTFMQQPPAFSAKKIDGQRSYTLARAGRSGNISAPALPAPVCVTVSELELLGIEHDAIRVTIRCSSGFYVRTLANDLGAALGVGGHLATLRRTEANGWTLGDSVPLAAIEDPENGQDLARRALIPLAEVLRELPRLGLTPEGVRRAATGCDIGERDCVLGWPHGPTGAFPPRVRLLTGDHDLVGIADWRPSGLLHPVVILM